MNFLANQKHSPETKLLLLCSSIRQTQETHQGLQSIVDGKIDWEIVLNGAFHHGIPPLVYHHLKTAGLENAVPAQAWAKLKNTYIYGWSRSAKQEYEYARLAEAFHDANIPVIPLKGMYLRESVYQDPALRVSGDIDLLVPGRATAKAEIILQQLGYDKGKDSEKQYDVNVHHHLAPYFLPGQNIVVEIHHNLAPPSCRLNIDIEAVWERSTSGQVAGKPAYILAPEDLLLHLALHGAAWYPSDQPYPIIYLRNLVDVCEAISFYQDRLNWDLVLKRAREWGVERHLYITLRLARDLLNVEHLDDILRMAAAERYISYVSRSKQVIFQLIEGKISSSDPEELQYLKLAKSPVEKMRVVYHALFPSRDKLGTYYHFPVDSKKVLLYHFRYPFRFFIHSVSFLKSKRVF